MLRTIIRALLIEGRLEDIKKKYPRMEKIIDHLSEADPSKNNKYLMWMADEVDYYSSEEWEQVANEAIRAIKIFHQNQKRIKEKDINQYESLKDLQATLATLPKSKTQQKKEAKAMGADVLLDDNDFLIIFMKSHEAVCHYGSGSKWCIKDKDVFLEYEDTFFYFVINKNLPINNPEYKIAISVDSDTHEPTLWNVENKRYDEDQGFLVFGKNGSNIRRIITKDAEARTPVISLESQTKELVSDYALDEDKNLKWDCDETTINWEWMFKHTVYTKEALRKWKSINEKVQAEIEKLGKGKPEGLTKPLNKTFVYALAKPYKDEVKFQFQYKGVGSALNFEAFLNSLYQLNLSTDYDSNTFIKNIDKIIQIAILRLSSKERIEKAHFKNSP